MGVEILKRLRTPTNFLETLLTSCSVWLLELSCRSITTPRYLKDSDSVKEDPLQDKVILSSRMSRLC